MHKYSPEDARIYDLFAIAGTTYEISFNEVQRLLGNLQDKTALDFGTGTGRSARLLSASGAKEVIAVDHDENMLARAQANASENLIFHLIANSAIPLPDETIDVAISTHVFVEMHTRDEIYRAAREIARVLKPGGTFILVTTNPDSIGYNYKSYRYRLQNDLKSGDPIFCLIKGKNDLEIEDTYWLEEDYWNALESVGLVKKQTLFPKAEGDIWLDERIVAPDMVLECIKENRYRTII